MLKKLENALDKIMIIFITFTFAIIIIFPIIEYYSPKNVYIFEYIDLDNKEGKAKYCSYKFKEYKKGGQGSPICELSDGTVKQVKQYKKVLVGTCVPAKDKKC